MIWTDNQITSPEWHTTESYLSFNITKFCTNIIPFSLQNVLCYRVSLHVKLCHKNFTCGAQEATLHILLFLPPNSWTGAISLLPPLTQNPDFFQNYSVPFLRPNFLALNRQTSLMINNIQQNCNKNGTRFVRNWYLLISTLKQSQYFCMHRKHQVPKHVNKHAYWSTPWKSLHFHLSWLLQTFPTSLKGYVRVFISEEKFRRKHIS